eukprot:TRINITY_DN40761_c0_g1_i1.p1 TRINITY_DN40761_c0_g1~~TRINITY_DN40761_c0_g1_i1.p1  ORF type:complete len:259 (+),score=89.91 TRINITY_DN40761_c0_g1_i1:55-831(+)
MRAAGALLALAALCLQPAAGFHFYLDKNQMWCFTEEVSGARTILHVGYKVAADFDSNEGVKIDVTNPRGTSVFADVLSKREGHFQVTVQGTEGPHAFCLTGSETRAVRFSLDVEVHETGTGDWTEHTDPASGRKFYHNPKTKESLWDLPKEAMFASTIGSKGPKKGGSSVAVPKTDFATSADEVKQYQMHIQAVQALMTQVKEDSSYLQSRQQRFKQTTDATAERVWWLAMFQVVICLALPLVQTVQLKRMFVKNKLV